MNKYKTFEELKEELGNNYDLFMYEINLQLLIKIDKAVDYIENNSLYDEILDYDYEENPYVSYTTDEYVKDNLLNILEGKENDL